MFPLGLSYNFEYFSSSLPCFHSHHFTFDVRFLHKQLYFLLLNIFNPALTSPIARLLPILRCVRADDWERGPREPVVPADLRRGQAAGLYSRHWSRMLDHPHGLQYLVVQTQEEKEWPLQQLCRHTQRSVQCMQHFIGNVHLDFQFAVPVWGYERFSHLQNVWRRCSAIFTSLVTSVKNQFSPYSSTQMLPTSLTS